MITSVELDCLRDLTTMVVVSVPRDAIQLDEGMEEVLD